MARKKKGSSSPSNANPKKFLSSPAPPRPPISDPLPKTIHAPASSSSSSGAGTRTRSQAKGGISKAVVPAPPPRSQIPKQTMVKVATTQQGDEDERLNAAMELEVVVHSSDVLSDEDSSFAGEELCPEMVESSLRKTTLFMDPQTLLCNDNGSLPTSLLSPTAMEGHRVRPPATGSHSPLLGFDFVQRKDNAADLLSSEGPTPLNSGNDPTPLPNSRVPNPPSTISTEAGLKSPPPPKISTEASLIPPSHGASSPHADAQPQPLASNIIGLLPTPDITHALPSHPGVNPPPSTHAQPNRRSYAQTVKDNPNARAIPSHAKPKKSFMNNGVGGKLTFVPPTCDHVLIKTTEAVPTVDAWGYALLGQFVGNLPGHFPITTMMKSWGVKSTYRLEEGWLIFQFESEQDQSKVLQGGPYFIFGRPMIIKLVPDKFAFNRKDVATIPLWVRLQGLSKTYWTQDVIARIASHIGKPLYLDPVTDKRKRGAYARALVEINFAHEIKREVMLKFDDGDSISCTFLIENEPSFCGGCWSFGHSSGNCSFKDKKVEITSREEEAAKEIPTEVCDTPNPPSLAPVHPSLPQEPPMEEVVMREVACLREDVLADKELQGVGEKLLQELLFNEPEMASPPLEDHLASVEQGESPSGGVDNPSLGPSVAEEAASRHPPSPGDPSGKSPGCLNHPTFTPLYADKDASWAPLVERGMEGANRDTHLDAPPDVGYLLALEAVPGWSKDVHARKGEGTFAKVPQ